MTQGPRWKTGWGEPCRPPHHQQPKLTPEQRDEIRQRVADGEAVLSLAAEFGVSVRTIRQNS